MTVRRAYRVEDAGPPKRLALYSTSNGFVSGTPLASVTNSFTGNPRIAQDAVNADRIWAVDHDAGGAGCGSPCFALSTDGGHTFSSPNLPQYVNASIQPTIGLFDVTSQGGAEVAVGSAGEIFTLIDGTNFYKPARRWRARNRELACADAYDSANAAVGGENGGLAITAQANTIPDIIPPTGTIAGPSPVTSGRAVTYTASVADNVGGSGINPGGYAWTVPGFPAQHSSSATYTFPRGPDRQRSRSPSPTTPATRRRQRWT